MSYNYDSYSRLLNNTITSNSTNYSTSFKYDNYSRSDTIIYPSGFDIYNIYNTFGYLSQVRRADNNALIWECESVNVFGGITQQKYGNNLTKTKTFDVLGMLRSITTGNVQNLSYTFDQQSGNLMARRDNLLDLMETFNYDELDRLTHTSGPAALYMDYSTNGNIASKTSIGEYTYGLKPHAVASVSNPEGLISSTEQRVTYTSFNKTDSIIQANFINTFTYGHTDQRTISRLFENDVLKKTTYYAGDYEEEVIPGQPTRKLHYISGGDGLAAIYVMKGTNDTMYYVHTDHLGSFDVITNQSGAPVQHYSFDAWGRRRNPTNWTYDNVPTSFLFARGYTGHEHLDQFALINMNGRMYDPLLSRFLAPDNFVQAPDFSQSFNRYSYCINNPLKYTDPSGEKWRWPKLRREHWRPIIGRFNYIMEMIDINTIKLRQQMTDAGIPDVSFGGIVNSGGGLTVYGGFTNPTSGGGGLMVGYNTNNGWGGSSGGTQLYFPSQDPSPAKISANFYNKMEGWRAYNRWRASFILEPLTLLRWEWVDESAQGQGGDDWLDPTLNYSSKANGGLAAATGARKVLEWEYIRQARINRILSGNYTQTVKHSMRAIKAVGKFTGVASMGISWADYANNPTTGNLIQAIANTGLVFVRVNPISGIIIGIADVTGASDYVYDQFGGLIDDF